MFKVANVLMQRLYGCFMTLLNINLRVCARKEQKRHKMKRLSSVARAIKVLCIFYDKDKTALPIITYCILKNIISYLLLC